MTDEYTGPEHHAMTPADVEKVLTRLLEAYTEREREWFSLAFPDGDLTAHRNYHQGLVDAAEEQKHFWEDARRILLSKGIDGLLSVLKIVFILAVIGAATKLGLTLPFLNK